ARPEEVSRWWLPGQWTAGGEKATWDRTQHRCHHPLRFGNRLYTSYWHAGFVILDIEDMRKPKVVSQFSYSPPFSCPTHTVLPVPFMLDGRQVMVVADEDTAKLRPSPPSFMWIFEVSDEKQPMPFATFQIDEVDGSPQPPHTGCHQPCEKITGTE